MNRPDKKNYQTPYGIWTDFDEYVYQLEKYVDYLEAEINDEINY